MRNTHRAGAIQRNLQRLLIAAIALLATCVAAAAQATTLNDMVEAVVRIKTFINPDGRSVSNLGREREGSGIIIDESGLVLTIGYLMVEAHAAQIVTNAGRTLPATIVGYDHETGFGLLRTIEPPKIKPLAFGKSLDYRDPELVGDIKYLWEPNRHLHLVALAQASMSGAARLTRVASPLSSPAAGLAAAIAAAGADDIVLLAGKGHEQGQIVGDKVLPFDDVTVARECAA